jgi:hypothetical protein
VRFEELLLRLKRVLKERKLTKIATNAGNVAKTGNYDGLTKLYNSRYFYNQLELEIDRSKRYNHPVSLLLLDIDHLNYTMTAMDIWRVIKFSSSSTLIKSCLRTWILHTDTVEKSSRNFAGNERQEAIGVAERIRRIGKTEKFTRKRGKEKRLPSPSVPVLLNIIRMRM